MDEHQSKLIAGLKRFNQLESFLIEAMSSLDREAFTRVSSEIRINIVRNKPAVWKGEVFTYRTLPDQALYEFAEKRQALGPLPGNDVMSKLTLSNINKNYGGDNSAVSCYLVEAFARGIINNQEIVRQ